MQILYRNLGGCIWDCYPSSVQAVSEAERDWEWRIKTSSETEGEGEEDGVGGETKTAHKVEVRDLC